MKRFIIGMLIAFSLFSIAAASTIGFIDVEIVFKSYKATKKAQDVIDKKMKDYRTKVRKRQGELEDAKLEGKSEEELQKIAEKIEKELDPLKAELEMLNREKMEKIRQDIITAVESVSREVGVDIVVDKQVIITGGIDLTDLAINKLNK